MMKIDISQVKQEVGSHRAFKLITAASGLGIKQDELNCDGSDIVVEGEVINNGQFLEIKGTIKTHACFVCNRCLKPFSMKLEVPFAERYFAPGFLPDEDTVIYEGNEIDITDLLRETLLLAEPLKPLCSESCKGLCPVCGADLNTKDCLCEKGLADPRLAVLQHFFKKE